MELLIGLFGGFGLGAILKTVVDHFLNRKKDIEERAYAEKRSAYLDLLDALHKAIVEPGLESAKGYALKKARVQIFGCEAVSKAAQDLVEAYDAPKEEYDAIVQRLIDGMRKDLSGINSK